MRPRALRTIFQRHPAGPLLRLVTALAMASCGGGEAGSGPLDEGGAPSTETGYLEIGDIDRLRQRGRLRFGNVPRAQLDEAPPLHWGSPSGDAVARAFTMRLGLEFEVVDYPTIGAATEALIAGRVDGIVGRRGVGIHPAPESVALSRPFRVEPGVFLARVGAAPGSLTELDGRTVAFGYEDGMIGFGAEIAAAASGVTIDTLEVLTVEDAVDRLASGEIDVTLAERWVAESLVDVHPELEMGMEFGSVSYAAEVRASNPDLLRLLNDFAFEALPVGLDAPPLLDDLPAIRDRRVLRVLTVNGPAMPSMC